jgi:hypothetical protein
MDKDYWEKRSKEFWDGIAEIKEIQKENAKGVKELKESIFGVSTSNGMIAEDYFYNSLSVTKTFGGVHYDDIERNIRQTRKLPDKTRVRGEYDIMLSNDNAACVIEAKYRVRKEDVTELAGRQAANFKILFPEYADYKLYLGIGGMCFEEGAEAEAKKLGMGILKLNGDAVEVQDADLKVY